MTPQDTPTPGTSVWDEDDQFPAEDWQYEVANGDTRRGYWDWVKAKQEEAQAERQPDDDPETQTQHWRERYQ